MNPQFNSISVLKSRVNYPFKSTPTQASFYIRYCYNLELDIDLVSLVII